MFPRKRFLFPAIYLALLIPVGSNLNEQAKFALVGLYTVLALGVNGRAMARMAVLIAISLTTFLVLSLIVQSAICSRSAEQGWRPIIDCAFNNSAKVLANVALLSAAVLVATSNEWRGSLVATIGGLTLPRSVRMMVMVSGAMMGEFQRAATRVHHAFTARGDASPSLRWRNLMALPSMLGVMWASVLNNATERLEGQWSANEFWERYVPSEQEVGSATLSDAIVIIVAGTVAALCVFAAL